MRLLEYTRIIRLYKELQGVHRALDTHRVPNAGLRLPVGGLRILKTHPWGPIAQPNDGNDVEVGLKHPTKTPVHNTWEKDIETALST